MANTPIKYNVNWAVTNLINGEIDAPIVPTILIQPKLNEVIYAGNNSAINTKNTPHTEFNTILNNANTII